MTNHRRRFFAAIALAAMLTGCETPGTAGLPGQPSPTGAPAVPVSGPVALDETSAELIEPLDFDALHGTGDREPIFGALPIEPAAADVPPETAELLGRWEGYLETAPVRRDWKYVLAVTDVTHRDGTAYLWTGTNLQYPSGVYEVHFRVVTDGSGTAIEWNQPVNGVDAVALLRHAPGSDTLAGGTTSDSPSGRLENVQLHRDSAQMMVDRDPAARLASLGITWQPHADPALAAFGAGELVYLPPGYADEPDRRWPLVLFFHGSGDRGDNGLFLAQNSPFRFITGGGSLDAVVVAPLLAADYASFPETYLDRVFDDALARFRVDPAQVAVTGLSMGGEASYRLARHRSDDVAALGVLCGFETDGFSLATQWGYQPIAEPWSGLAGMPIRVIHGRDDTIVPLSAAEAAVAAMQEAGVAVTFDILEGHDHDVWSDTYSDPAFFEWLLDAVAGG